MQSTSMPNRFNGLKWLIGLLFLSLFSSFLLLLGLYNLTSEQEMKPIIGKTLNIIFRQEGTDQVVPAINYINELSKHGNEISQLQKISSLDQAQIEKEIQGLSPEDSQRYFEEKFADPLYNGSKVVDSLKTVDPNAKIDAGNLDFIRVATITTHNQLFGILKYEAIILALLLFGLIALSTGWSRISSPAILIFIAGLPGFLFTNYFNQLVEKLIKPYLGDIISGPIYIEISRKVINPALLTFRTIYIIPTVVGLSFFILALILGSFLNKKRIIASKENSVPLSN